MRISLSSPAATCEQASVPAEPLLSRTNALQSSSRRRPSTTDRNEVGRAAGCSPICALFVESAGRHLRAGERAGGAVVEPHKRIAIVVEAAAFHHRSQRCVDARHLESGNVLEQVKGMRADVANGAALPVLCGISAPRGLLVTGGFNRLAHPPLEVFTGNLG